MSEYSIRWDAENRHHIFGEHAERGLTRAEVEQVVLSSSSVRWRADNGRTFAQGRTLTGRCVRVVYSGLYDVRPVTAYRRPLKECEQWKS